MSITSFDDVISTSRKSWKSRGFHVLMLSGKTLYCILYWVLLLVWCGASGKTLLVVIVDGLCAWGLGQHTLLGIGASDNTLYWVSLWAMRGFGQHTLLGRPHQWVKKIIVEKSKCRCPYLLRSGYPLTHKITWHCFPVSQLISTPVSQLTSTNVTADTIRQISYSQTCTFPNRPEDGYASIIK
jgi:hypothetical protein